jgi:hypothetical protein
MLKGLSRALLCSVFLVGQIHAQEVIVVHETKPEGPKQEAPSPEETSSESPSPARNKPKSREKRSTSATPTAEQMRIAGALAAERLENRNLPQAAGRRGSDSEPAATETPTVSGTAGPTKKETRAGQTRTPRPPNSRTLKPETIGAVRPTMVESGRQEPSATPSPKAEARSEYTPVP